MSYSNRLFIFLVIPFFYQCQQERYINKETEAGQKILTINSDKTYEYVWYRYYDVGPINDTIYHKGTWTKRNDTLILNSYETPNNFDFISVKEEKVKSDSIKILITSDDDIPFFFIAPKSIRINNKHYQLPEVNIESLIRFSVPAFEINHIILPGYPIYKSINKKSNYFHFIIKELTEMQYQFPENTFFLNEKFLIEDDTLFQLHNNEKITTFIKSN